MFAYLLSRCSTTTETSNSLLDTNSQSQYKLNTTSSFKVISYNNLRREKFKNKTKVLTQSMMRNDSTIYIIEYDYNLKGETITVPDNCILEFHGGSFKNGTIIGKNTNIRNETENVIFTDVTFKGTYVQDYICSEWFEYDNLCRLFDAIQIIATSDNLTRIVVNKMTTTYQPIVRNFYNGEKVSYLFKIPSNTSVDFCGSELTLSPNDISIFYAIYIQNVTNVEVKNLILTGDVESHSPTRYNEYSHGIYIYASQNVKLDNIVSTKFWGDGMGISGYADASKPVSKNVTVKNCKFAKNRRQGCSITAGTNLLFLNCDFLETGTIKGTSPSAGVDIEPNNGGDVLKNIVFKNCKFLDNEGDYGGVLIMTAKLANDLKAEEISFSYCDIDGIHQYGKGGGFIKACVISNSKNRENCLKASKNLIVESCTIKFNKVNLKTNYLSNTKYINNTFCVK